MSAAENAVVGALIVEPEFITRVPDVRGEHFAQPWAANTVDACRDYVSQLERGTLPDTAGLMSWLQNHGLVERCGGGAHLASLSRSDIEILMIETHGRQVLHEHRARCVGALGRTLQQIAETPGSEEELTSKMRLMVDRAGKLTDPHTGNAPTDLEELGAFTDMWDDPRDILIPGVMERGDRVIVVADEGAGKTTLARQIAVACSQGVHPFEPRLRLAAPLRVLFVDLENPKRKQRKAFRDLIEAVSEVTGSWRSDTTALWRREGGINLRNPVDALELERRAAHHKPDLLVLGPLYKAYDTGRDNGNTAALECAKALDRIRETHSCGLWLETHAPMPVVGGGRRDLRPVDASVWMRWPEYGLALRRDTEIKHYRRMLVERFRGDREVASWPDAFEEGQPGQLPWLAYWQNGTPIELRPGMGEAA